MEIRQISPELKEKRIPIYCDACRKLLFLWNFREGTIEIKCRGCGIIRQIPIGQKTTRTRVKKNS